jgi:site-specific recombinase XerD
MKITKTVHHEKIRWRVNDSISGKRQRRFFETKEDAENFVRQRKADQRAFGNQYNSIPPADRVIIGCQLERLHKLGWSLPDAVDYIERQGKKPQSIRLGVVADGFLAAQNNRGLRPRYLRTLRASINRFLINRREKQISNISTAEIQEYINCNGWANATKRSYLVDVRTLFAFAVKRKYLAENPAMAVDMPKTDEKPPGILTVTQAEKLLATCLDNAPDNLAVIVLSLFAGIRRAEAEKIQWDEIGDEFIEIKPEKAKTRRRRLVPISSQLCAWLDVACKIGAKLPAINYADKLKRTLEKAELQTNWPQNALRHSFASYHFAKFKKENDTAAIMGNSPQMVFGHYRQIVKPAEAEKFFDLMPPPDAVARAAAARDRQKMPPIPGKIKPEILSAIFEGGKRMLSRKDAVIALREKTGCNYSSAYAALSATGRFRSVLRENDGLLIWQINPLLPEIIIPAEKTKNPLIPVPILTEAESIPAHNQ